ncbi:hypothetical protein USDA257_c09190 [Sinorhizobium fredii USDA 257]|uniref:Uncharacterized protein n=1 Tax=Sinorhizobium fredii (strain USDA 257) TaxID=1185652 RepID=I3X0V5_SINF2|nr:hypothetical protein USDA257_c09190 [Sinorhizobium fredii USDA 257]
MSHASLLPQQARRGKNPRQSLCGERFTATCLYLGLQSSKFPG